MKKKPELSTEEIFQTAAEWWGQAIRDPEKGVYGKKRQLFSDNLRDLIEKTIDPVYRYLELRTEHYPDPVLLKAAKHAGISPKNFPWKTTMWIDCQRGVIIKAGEYAPEQQIYPVQKPI